MLPLKWAQQVAFLGSRECLSSLLADWFEVGEYIEDVGMVSVKLSL